MRCQARLVKHGRRSIGRSLSTSVMSFGARCEYCPHSFKSNTRPSSTLALSKWLGIECRFKTYYVVTQQPCRRLSQWLGSASSIGRCVALSSLRISHLFTNRRRLLETQLSRIREEANSIAKGPRASFRGRTDSVRGNGDIWGIAGVSTSKAHSAGASWAVSCTALVQYRGCFILMLVLPPSLACQRHRPLYYVW